MKNNLAYRRILHRMGYYNYQRGLICHHFNEEGSWSNHLERCRTFILKAVESRRPSRITVLGSGWLLDVPLREMLDTASEIFLVDIVHPPEVREQVTGLSKVTLLEDDATGGLIYEVWEKARRRFFINRLKSPDNIAIGEYEPRFDPGMVISLNILTQLEHLPLEFLKKRCGADSNAFLRFRKRIQEKHLDFLKKHQSVLISDVSEIITGSSGKATEIPSLLIDLPGALQTEEWIWYFEQKSPDFYSKKSSFRVRAMMF